MAEGEVWGRERLSKKKGEVGGLRNPADETRVRLWRRGERGRVRCNREGRENERERERENEESTDAKNKLGSIGARPVKTTTKRSVNQEVMAKPRWRGEEEREGERETNIREDRKIKG